jgi:G-patch domain
MSDDDTYEIPLQDQRVFGAGIRRKRVKFVPSTAASSTPPISSGISAKSVSDFYLKIVLPSKDDSSTEAAPAAVTSSKPPISPDSSQQPQAEQTELRLQICEICNLPLATSPENLTTPTREPSGETGDMPTKPRPHEASLAHQVCLTHSHPPSHLDRNRKGLAYLSSYGWDPDARVGLGASGQGIQYPIKTKPKDDTLGIGAVLPREAERRKKEKVEKLDAGKVRKLHEEDKKKAEKLREMFYRNDDVERYLGGG